jgi:LysR family hydrogen peroxide-inducible transcriptional activator
MNRFAPHPFSLRKLQYVVALSETLSFRRAAERCRVSQPALSAQLLELEDLLGARLFDRERRSVRLTPAGRAFVQRAQRVLVGADELARTSRGGGREPLEGPLRLGVIPTIAAYLLPSASPALKKAFPKLEALWVEDRTTALLSELESGEVEAALVALEAPLGDVEHAAIAVDELWLALPRDHALAKERGALRTSAIRRAELLVMDEGHCLGAQTAEFCARMRAETLEFRATSLPTLAQMVGGGRGLTLLPALAAPLEAPRARLALRRFRPPAPRRTIALVWRRSSALGAAFQRIAAAIRAAYPGPRPPSRTT